MSRDYTFNNDTSKKERREVFDNDKKVREANTYFGRSHVDNEDAGGRYSSLIPKAKTGDEPIGQYPQQPSNSPWYSDPVPKEGPLGFSVNDQEPIGSRAEQIEAEKLLDAREGATSVKGAQPSPSPSVAPSSSSRIRRRV